MNVKKLRQANKGITLIALVVTIVILLILATISINMLFGSNGLITKAQIAKNEMEVSTLKESLDMYYLNNSLEGKYEDPIGEKVVKEEITDHTTIETILKFQSGVASMDQIDFSNMYYIDLAQLNLSGISEKRYFMDTSTNIVFINEGIELNAGKIYVLEEKNIMPITLETQEIEEGFKLIATVQATDREVSGYTFFLNNQRYKEVRTNQKTIELEVTDQGFDTIECFVRASGTDGTIFSSNKVNVDNYIIRTVVDFNKLRTRVAEGDTFFGKKIRIVNDIELEGNESNKNWVSIGDETTPFSGTHEGNNHKILNLYNSDTKSNNQGLFGYTENATMQNIVIESGKVEGAEFVGGIVGKARNTHFINCTNNINIEASKGVIGGIVGKLDGTEGVITECTNSGEIIGKQYTSLNSRNETFVGGIVGYTEATINECLNKGNIIGEYSVVGGIAGVSHSDINNCYNNGKVETTGTNTDYNSVVGGIAGAAHNAKIENCYNQGEIYAPGNMVGGIVGLLINNSEITTCYNEGNITTESGQIGGITGCLRETCYVRNSYNSGNIIAKGNSKNETKDSYIGGITGIGWGIIEKCWNTGNIESNSGAIGGVIGAVVNGEVKECYNTAITISTGANINGDVSQGGIAGYAENSEINYCYNIGNIQSDYNSVGGLIGIVNKEAVIKNSYNAGNVTGKQNVGKMIGLNLNQKTLEETAANCYYLGTTTLGASRTETDMKTTEFINLIGGESIWKLDSENINNGFIILNWQK